MTETVLRMMNRIKYYLRRLKCRRIAFKSKGQNISFGVNYTILSPECISIGTNFHAGTSFKLLAWTSYRKDAFSPIIEIGNDVSIMNDCQISCCEKVVIRDGCLFGDNVFITDNFHGDNSWTQMSIPPIERPLFVKGGVSIGKNVWVGRNVCIMPGVNIGDGAIIGANAVVTHDIPAYSVAAGIPAKVIRVIKE